MLVKSGLALLLFTNLAFAQVSIENDTEKYNYPVANPYYATLTNLAIDPRSYIYKTASLELKPNRSHLPGLSVSNKIEFTYNVNNPEAPLIIIVAGLGGGAKSSSALLLAQLMTRLGYNAVTVANPFTWQFSVSVSETGLVGYAPDDARDLYNFLKVVRDYLVKNAKIQTNRYGLIGYSMGALDAGFLLKYDLEHKDFNFARTLLINSPLNLKYSITALDKLYSEGQKISAARKSWDLGYLYDFYEKMKPLLDRGVSITELLARFKLTETDVKWLIGESFEESLTDVILASQQVKDLGLLKSPVNSINARTEEAGRFTFEKFTEKFFYPNYMSRLTLDEFYESGSLTSIFDILESNPGTFLFHNADDFLYQPELTEVLQSKMGQRFKLFPHGGHLGNLWYPENLKTIANVMSGM